MPTARDTTLAISIFGLALAAAGCGAPGDVISSEEEAILRADSIARAEEWVSAKLQYCQSANHQRDYDDACTTYCERTDNKAWDPYRSDCSGLVSWAWALPSPGRVTGEFAPFENDITGAIAATSLIAGDAVNNSDHIMLFKAWITPHSRATFIEEPGCATSITHAHEFDSDVSVSGHSIYVSYVGMDFTAIRFKNFGAGGSGGGGGGGTGSGDCVAGGLYCGGDKVSGDSGTLYRCNASGAPTVVERCANGCDVMAGRDDACGSGSGAGSGGCTPGGYYCGGDKVSGAAGTLYRCVGGSDPVVVERCANGCQVNPGQDDNCKAVGGGSCVSGGLYCGGDKVSGDTGTLYRCNGAGAPSVVAHCSDGCQINSGSDDSCHGKGGCVTGGTYCGGDKVSGDPRTLYRCNGAGAPSVVAQCADGCEVLSGRNDACK